MFLNTEDERHDKTLSNLILPNTVFDYEPRIKFVLKTPTDIRSNYMQPRFPIFYFL